MMMSSDHAFRLDLACLATALMLARSISRHAGHVLVLVGRTTHVMGPG
jgi:hypothetical protein